MLVFGTHRRSIEPHPDGKSVVVIDQTRLPHACELVRLGTLEDVAGAIRTMVVRGAPLIGVTAAYGMAIAKHAGIAIDAAYETLLATRPTAVNLRWALDRMRKSPTFAEANAIAEEDVAMCKAIGEHGVKLFPKKEIVNVLTHCNAGWLACVDWGTALSAIYRAHDSGTRVHVWVSETRPRNQGAQLTAWELGAHGIPHTIVADNACGHLIARGKVDLCIVGADRVTARGDVANKIGTYLKALACRESGVPFHVAFPSSTIDFALERGEDIPIEERSPDEVTTIGGVRIAPEKSVAFNPGFDVTPARFVTGFITERGTCAPDALRTLHA